MMVKCQIQRLREHECLLFECFTILFFCGIAVVTDGVKAVKRRL